jgi:hypothetical protein
LGHIHIYKNITLFCEFTLTILCIFQAVLIDMCADFNEGHFNHDPKWIYFTDQREACVACIVENIENQQISHLQKTSSITLLSKLIQAPDVTEDLKSHPNITCHIVHVILGTSNAKQG